MPFQRNQSPIRVIRFVVRPQFQVRGEFIRFSFSDTKHVFSADDFWADSDGRNRLGDRRSSRLLP